MTQTHVVVVCVTSIVFCLTNIQLRHGVMSHFSVAVERGDVNKVPLWDHDWMPPRGNGRMSWAYGNKGSS